MIRSLIKLGLILIAGILIYNYFLGTAEEKEQSRKIFKEVGDLGKSAWDLLKSEKQKFDEGKYDEAVDKIGGLFQSLKSKAEDIGDSGILDQLAELEKRRANLEKRLNENPIDEYDTSEEASRQKEDLKQEWEDLLQETEELMKKMEEK